MSRAGKGAYAPLPTTNDAGGKAALTGEEPYARAPLELPIDPTQASESGSGRRHSLVLSRGRAAVRTRSLHSQLIDSGWSWSTVRLCGVVQSDGAEWVLNAVDTPMVRAVFSRV